MNSKVIELFQIMFINMLILFEFMMKVMPIKSYCWSWAVCHECSSWFWVKIGQSVEMPLLFLAVCLNIVSNIVTIELLPYTIAI